MRYFRNGNRVIRVDVGTDAPLGPDLLESVAEVYSLKKHEWVERSELMPEIVYTGDWNSCTEDEALQAIKIREMRLQQQTGAVAYP
jgi:hypothetical protein